MNTGLAPFARTTTTACRLVVVLFGVGWPPTGHCQARAEVEAYILAEMELNSIPGLSYAVVRSGAVSLAGAYGVRNMEGDPMRPDTPVHLASVSKPLTALAIRRLELQQKLDRTAPAARYLPELAVGDARWRHVTVAHLLRHRSGLRRRSDFLVPCCGKEGPFDAALAASYLAEAKLENEPGAAFSYANSNYVLLAALVERVSGRPFAAYMRYEVFLPLGMNRTTLRPEEAAAWDRADPHEWQWGRVRFSPSLFFGWYGASLVQSTAEDMGALLEALLSEDNPVYGGTPAPWWKQLEHPYDDGWYVEQEAWWLDGHQALEHSGNIWGGNTAAALAPGLAAGAVVLTNLGTERAHHIARGLLRDAAGLPLPDPGTVERLEVPDTWAVALTACALILFLGSCTFGLRMRRRLQSGDRIYRVTAMGLLRAGILLALVLLLAYSLLGGRATPLAALPSTVKVALPLLACGFAVALFTAAAAGLTPRRNRRTSFRSGREGPRGSHLGTGIVNRRAAGDEFTGEE